MKRTFLTAACMMLAIAACMIHTGCSTTKATTPAPTVQTVTVRPDYTEARELLLAQRPQAEAQGLVDPVDFASLLTNSLAFQSWGEAWQRYALVLEGFIDKL